MITCRVLRRAAHRWRPKQRNYPCLAVFVGLLACSSPSPSIAPTATTIGASGGTLTSSDGVVTLSIPAGALSNDVLIGIGPATGVPAGTTSLAYEISPTGTVFTVPASLSMLTGADAGTNLGIATVVGGQWSPLAMSTLSDGMARAPLAHLSPYALIKVLGDAGAAGASGTGGRDGNAAGGGASGTGGSSVGVGGAGGVGAAGIGVGGGRGIAGSGGTAGGSQAGNGGLGGSSGGQSGSPGSSMGGTPGNGGSAVGGSGTGGNGTGSGGSVTRTPGVSCPSAATFCNGFETPGLPNGAAYLVDSPSGPVPGDFGSDFVIDTSQHHFGQSSLLININEGNANRMLAVPVPLNVPFWVRFWVESDMPMGNTGYNTFAGASAGPSGDTPDALMIEFAENVGIGFNTGGYAGIAGGYDTWPTGYGQLPDGGTNPYTLPAMTWACVELSYDVTTSRVQQLFINATELINGTDYPSVAAFPAVSAGSAIFYFKFGFDMHDGPARRIWYDDVAVAPTRGGCL